MTAISPESSQLTYSIGAAEASAAHSDNRIHARIGAQCRHLSSTCQRPSLRLMGTMAKPLAVVAGASTGIGFELARQFAEHGFDLVIAAEGARIETAAVDLRQHGG